MQPRNLICNAHAACCIISAAEPPGSPRSPSGKKRKLLSEADAVAARQEALEALLTARRVTEKVCTNGTPVHGAQLTDSKAVNAGFPRQSADFTPASTMDTWHTLVRMNVSNPPRLQGIDAFNLGDRDLQSLPEPAPAAQASVHAWRLIEVSSAKPLLEAHTNALSCSSRHSGHLRAPAGSWTVARLFESLKIRQC